MIAMRLFLTRLKLFLSETRASLSVEFVIAVPIIIWAYGGMFVFWDAFKSQNINVKAAYTISDLISRAETDITETNVDRMYQVLDYLNYEKHPVRMRISFVHMEDDGAGNPELVLPDGASRVRGPAPVAPFDAMQTEPFLPHTNVDALAPFIPIMAIGDSVIVVETQLDYTPLVEMVVYRFPPRILSELVVTRPRLSNGVEFADPSPSG